MERACPGPVLVLLVALATGTGLARAQETDDPAAVARRVHQAGGYAADVVVLGQEAGGAGGAGAEGAGRGPRGETSIDGEREPSDAGRSPAMPAWLRDALDWLGAALSGLAGPLGYAFLALGLAVIAMLVAFGVASLRFRSPRVEPGPRRGEEGQAGIDPFLVGSGESADALAAQGRWREAIHALFLDALREVGGAEGRLRSHTARELVDAVDRDRRGRAELGALLDLAELVWFGGRAATEAQYRDARELASAVAREGGRR